MASGMLGVMTVANGNRRRVSASAASSAMRRAPEVATITGSTTTFVALHALRRSAITSIISVDETMPILTALGRISSKMASICAATISGEIFCTAVTPSVFCAVMAVMAVSAYRRCAVMVLMSA